MSTLLKLHAQPVAAGQFAVEVSSAPPASGGAVGLESTTEGSTTATLTMLNPVLAVVESSPTVSGCGVAVPETVTSDASVPAIRRRAVSAGTADAPIASVPCCCCYTR